MRADALEARTPLCTSAQPVRHKEELVPKQQAVCATRLTPQSPRPSNLPPPLPAGFHSTFITEAQVAASRNGTFGERA